MTMDKNYTYNGSQNGNESKKHNYSKDRRSSRNNDLERTVTYNLYQAFNNYRDKSFSLTNKVQSKGLFI